MKLLYIVPNINNEGGVARVLSIKTNYLVEKLDYQVHILTQNDGNLPLFYPFSKKIIFHDIILKGSGFQFINSYKKALRREIKVIVPDIIIVCDFGLKAFTVPFILDSKIPIVFECHGSKYIEESKVKNDLFSKIKRILKHKFKDFGAKKFDKFVVETPESIIEWGINDGIVISNPLWFSSETTSDLKTKKVIAVGRHTYEKGFDRLLQIWQKVLQKHPDWMLDIYGKSNKEIDLKKISQSLNISNNVTFYEPVTNIDEKYLDSSCYLMTSHFEGFGMVLIEAMASGLPCIAYDCPCGPRAIISNNENGFLINDNNEDLFIQKLTLIIEDENLRKKLGEKAKTSSEKYNLETIMKTWDAFFIDVLKNK